MRILICYPLWWVPNQRIHKRIEDPNRREVMNLHARCMAHLSKDASLRRWYMAQWRNVYFKLSEWTRRDLDKKSGFYLLCKYYWFRRFITSCRGQQPYERRLLTSIMVKTTNLISFRLEFQNIFPGKSNSAILIHGLKLGEQQPCDLENITWWWLFLYTTWISKNLLREKALMYF